jgi:putative NADPH-quinone reductase
MKIYLFVAHPDGDSLCTSLANAYAAGALSAGHEVRRQDIANLQFDPILHKGYKTIQPLEKDLIIAQENISWCNKWVIFYPLWWGSVPAAFKGFLDRTLLPGFAFKHHENDPFQDKLLKGRSAHLICTSDAPSFWIWAVYRNADYHFLKAATLNYCGFNPVRINRLGRIRFRKPEEINNMLDKMKKVGANK